MSKAQIARDPDFLDSVPIFTGLEERQPPARTPLDLVAQGQTMMQTRTEYHTAVGVQRPRDLDRIVAAALEEADYAGSEFFYSWPVKEKDGGRKIVEGPTIGAAMAVLRLWGNCALDVDCNDRGTHLVFTPRFIDLEKGTTIARAYKYRPTPAPGKYDEARWADMQFQLAQSKAIRNVVNTAMPRWLMQAVVERAKKAELSAIDRVGLHEARQRAVDHFERLGVSEARLAAYVGVGKDKWTREDIAGLRSIGRQIRDGEVGPDEIFPQVEDQAHAGAAEKAAEQPAGSGKGKARADKGNGRQKPAQAAEGPKEEPPADRPSARVAARLKEAGIPAADLFEAVGLASLADLDKDKTGRLEKAALSFIEAMGAQERQGQAQPGPIGPEDVEALSAELRARGVDEAAFLSRLMLSDLAEITTDKLDLAREILAEMTGRGQAEPGAGKPAGGQDKLL